MELKVQQPFIYQQLSSSFAMGRLAHAYLFEGGPGTGKKEAALWLSQLIFCLETQTEPCGKCLNCRRIQAGEHPDVTTIVPDGQSIKVEQVREIKEVLVKSGVESTKKVLVISEAEKMTVSAANSLLKFIEEPDGDIVIIFLTTTKGKMLPTILSRCQVLHFLPLPIETVESALVAKNYAENDAHFLAQLTRNTEMAIEISQEEWFNETKEIATKWVDYLISRDPFSFVYVQQKLLKNFTERERQLFLFEMILVMFRHKLNLALDYRHESGTQDNWSEKQLVQAIELILQSQRKLTANVSFQNVCEQLSIFLSAS